MASDSPFFFTRIECPICKTVNEFETVKVGSYTESGRDTDFCPQGVKWRHSRYQAYDPLLFFAATCTNCFYTREFNNSYKEWKTDNHFRTYRLKSIKAKHLDQLARADSAIRQMGAAIDVSRHPVESAILKMHLTVYDELLADRVVSLDVGRLYLRIGWLYRNIGHSENPSLTFLKGLMREMDVKIHDLRESQQKCENQLLDFGVYMTAHYESNEVTSEIKSQMLPYRERFEAELQNGLQAVSNCKEQLSRMSDLAREYKASALGTDDAGTTDSFGQSPSFAAFQAEIKQVWDGAVANEQEALEQAVFYYKEAFESGTGIAAGNQQIQASYLIAELSRRIGDYDQARLFFNSTIKYGQDFIYKNRNDQSKTALARKILELAMEQNRSMLAEAKQA